MQGGISTPSDNPLILLFTTSHGDLYGYEDRFQPDGMFWYTGEGQMDDMVFARGNQALRDHETEGRRVFLFEQTRKGYVRFIGEMRCDGQHIELRPDRNGQQRQAIVFHLEVVTPGQDTAPAPGVGAGSSNDPKGLSGLSLDELRNRALMASSTSAPPQQRAAAVRCRAEAIRQYALKRASGTCESCLQPAPFRGKQGPFLEVHHLHRLSDGGPDHPSSVAAVCPNCHREVHYGNDRVQKNQRLLLLVAKKEESLTAKS